MINDKRLKWMHKRIVAISSREFLQNHWRILERGKGGRKIWGIIIKKVHSYKW